MSPQRVVFSQIDNGLPCLRLVRVLQCEKKPVPAVLGAEDHRATVWAARAVIISLQLNCTCSDPGKFLDIRHNKDVTVHLNHLPVSEDDSYLKLQQWRVVTIEHDIAYQKSNRG